MFMVLLCDSGLLLELLWFFFEKVDGVFIYFL